MTAKKNGNEGRPRTKARRVVFRVNWSGHKSYWTLKGNGEIATHIRKQSAVQDGVERATALHSVGVLTQLVIHNKDGRIQSERTYGADPVRRKG